MSWPLSQDFNEAVQNPATGFADPDLKGATVAAGPTGVPLPRSGNYADVYQFTGADGRRWAVKCFTRPVAPDLDARYAAIADHLARANLPFTVGFDFLRQGIRVRGRYYPVVKMPWVDGFPINQFVRDHLNRASVLEAMLSLWVRLCRRLRETGMAHCDLQHGNVLLVPAGGKANALELKLVDYDGMYVPALAGRPPGEAGHAAYQHPDRAATNAYSADLDRFPHLVVATALRGLLVGGRALWDRYDTGDNLLFAEKDFRAPGRSKLMRELWDTGDPFTVGLLAHLVLACGKPLAQAPWLDQLMPEGRPPVLTPSQERQAAAALGVPLAAGLGGEPPPVAAPVARPSSSPPGSRPAGPRPVAAPATAAVATEEDETTAGPRKAAGGGTFVAAIAAGGILLIGALVGGGMVLLGEKTPPTEVTQSTLPPSDTGSVPITAPAPAPTPTTAPIPTPASAPVKAKPPVTPAPPPVVPVSAPRPKTAPAPATGPTPVWKAPLDPDLSLTPAAVHYSLDGSKLIAAEQRSGTVYVLDAATGKRITTVTEAGGPAAAVPLAGGRVLTAPPGARDARVLDDTTGRVLDSFRLPPDGRARILAASPDGRYALIALAPGTAVLDTRTGKTTSLSSAPNVLARMSADGTRVLLVEGAKVRVYATPDGRQLTALDLPFPAARAAAVAPDGMTAAVLPARQPGEPGPAFHLYDLATGKLVRTLPGDFAPAPGASQFSRDGRLFAAAVRPADSPDTFRLDLWDVKTGKPVTGPADPVTAAGGFDFSPDGRRLVVFAADRYFHVYDLPAAPAEPPPVAAAPPARPARRPVPDAAAVARADAEVKEAYKADFARKAVEDRKRLAEKLAKEAEQTADPVARYAVLRAAEALAAEVGELSLALKVIDALDQEYEIDGPAGKVAAIEKTAAAVSRTAALKATAEAALETADELAEKDRLDDAAKLAGVAAGCLAKCGQTAAARDAETRRQQLLKQRDAFEPVRPAAEALKTNPRDAAAALAVGKFRALVQGRWDDALPMLAAGTDPGLKALAEQDLRAPVDAATTDTQRGAAWAEYAQGRPEAERGPYLARAKYWYARALTTLRGGVELETAKAKLTFTAGGMEYRPGLVAEFFTGPLVNVKRLGQVDFAADVTTRDHQGLGLPLKVVWTGVLVPPAAGRYRLVADTTDQVRVRLFTKPDEKLVIDAVKGGVRPEAAVVLPERPVRIVIEYAAVPGGGARQPQNHTFALKWVRPGGKTPEPIPPDVLFHPKELEKLLTEK